MLAALKRTAKRSKWAVVAVSIAKDLAAGLAARRGVVESTSGSTHLDRPLAESLDYVDRVFDDYLAYGQIGPDGLRGARVLEVGPGDNLGVAFRFVAAGAERVVSVDRFASRRDEAQQAKVYAALAEREGVGRDLLGRVDYREGVAIEQADRELPGPFDLIVSRAVLEHVFNPGRALAAMDRLLSGGGTMIHKIDFRDHEMFSGGGQHPLTFLTIPDAIYRQMSMRSGRPNRHLVGWYRSRFSDLGYDVTVLAARLVGAEDELDPPVSPETIPELDLRRALEVVGELQPRLVPRLREADPADLAISSAFVIAHKPVL